MRFLLFLNLITHISFFSLVTTPYHRRVVESESVLLLGWVFPMEENHEPPEGGVEPKA